MTTQKTASKKTASPKQAAKKSTPSRASKRVLARAEGTQCFWVTDGKVLSDLVEFGTALHEMEKEVFGYHVSGSRNDFADWIEYVLGDTELAGMLRKTKTSKQAHTVVLRRLKIYDLP
jgi:hypothetical protein